MKKPSRKTVTHIAGVMLTAVVVLKAHPMVSVDVSPSTQIVSAPAAPLTDAHRGIPVNTMNDVTIINNGGNGYVSAGCVSNTFNHVRIEHNGGTGYINNSKCD
jgi:hypothetical protein